MKFDRENCQLLSLSAYKFDFKLQFIYVTDAGQAMHFQILEHCARRAKILTPRHRLSHVPFGVVLGQDKKKFKTRSGDTIKLIDLLEEGNYCTKSVLFCNYYITRILQE